MAKRGRPCRPPSAAEREKVEELVGLEAPIADIAKLIGRSIPNLRKYFSKELFSGKKLPVSDFKPTKALRTKVARYIGCKLTPTEVAGVLDISLEDLERHFPAELKTGYVKTRANVIDHLHDQMEEGHVGATNRLEAMTATGGANDSPAAAPGYVGKKVAARLAAEQAVTGNNNPFAPRPPPRVVVNNVKP